MKPRTAGILFLLAAALGAFVWFYEIRGEAGRRDSEAAAKRLFPGIESSAVEQIDFTTSDGQRARLAHRDAEWQLALPLAAQADGFVADAIASALAQLGSESVYETPQPLAVYGLEDAGRDLQFHAAGADHVLRLGRKTPVGGNHYAYVGGQSRVYVVSGIAVNALTKSLDELREKRVLRFDAGSVERATLRWPGAHVVLARNETGWQLEEPLVGPADATTVEGLLSDLSFLRASGFVDAPTAEQARALEHPDFEVELTTKAEGEGKQAGRVSLAIGAHAGAEADRLVRAGGPGLFRIPSERLQDFPREVGSYRFRELAHFDLEQAERLEIAFQPGGEAALTLSATHGKQGWSSTPEEIDPAKLATMVDELSRLRAKQILADALGEPELRQLGLAPPSARFTVSGKDGQLAQVDVGIVRGSDGVVARATGGPIVYLLAPTLADYLPVSVEALRSRFLATAADAKPPTASGGTAEGAPEAASESSPEEGAPQP